MRPSARAVARTRVHAPTFTFRGTVSRRSHITQRINTASPLGAPTQAPITPSSQKQSPARRPGALYLPSYTARFVGRSSSARGFTNQITTFRKISDHTITYCICHPICV